MYNTDLPTHAELPSSARLLWSTILAAIAAIVLLISIVLPSEYAVDPTGVGRMLGLTQMGEIKMQLADEAEADLQLAQQNVSSPAPAPAQLTLSSETERLDTIERRLDEIMAALQDLQSSRPALAPPDPIAEQIEPATESVAEPATEPVAEPAAWRDEIEITLQPGQGVEFKLVMEQGAIAEFQWTANGGVLNHDTHGNGNGNSISYEKGRAVPGQEDVLEAAFTGNHGWFWRNRTNAPVTLTLRTRGDYSELKRTV